MNMHIHSTRTLFGWMVGIIALLAPIALVASSGLSAERTGLVPVTGRVDLDGHPVGDMLICFDSDGDHIAQDWLGADGSFRLYTHGRGDGAVPGKYHVHLFPKYPSLLS